MTQQDDRFNKPCQHGDGNGGGSVASRRLAINYLLEHYSVFKSGKFTLSNIVGSLILSAVVPPLDSSYGF